MYRRTACYARVLPDEIRASDDVNTKGAKRKTVPTDTRKPTLSDWHQTEWPWQPSPNRRQPASNTGAGSHAV